MAVAEITLTGNAKDAQKELDRVHNKLIQLTGQMEKLKQEGKAGGKSVSDGLADATLNAGKLVMGLAGIGSAAAGIMTVVNVLKSEYENLVRRQREAATTQMGMADVMGRARMALPPQMTGDQLQAMVATVSRGTGIKQEEIFKGMLSALPAMGNLSVGQYESAAMMAARLRAAGGPTIDVGQMTGTLADIMRTTGAPTGQQAAGWVRRIGVAGHIGDVAGLAHEVLPVVAAGAEGRATPQEAVALMAYLGQVTGDTSGGRPASGAVNFLRAMEEAELIPSRRLKGGRWETQFRRAEGATFGERLAEINAAYAAASPAMRTEMLSKMPGKGGIRRPLELLAMGDRGALAQLAALQGQIGAPTDAALTADIESYISGVQAMPGEPLRAMQRQFAIAQEQMKVANPQAMAGLMRAEIEATLKDMPGVSRIEQRIASAEFELGTGFGYREVGRAAQARIEQLRRANRYASPTIWEAGPMAFSEAAIGPGAGWQEVPSKDYIPAIGKTLDVLSQRIGEITELAEKGMPVDIRSIKVPRPNGAGVSNAGE